MTYSCREMIEETGRIYSILGEYVAEEQRELDKEAYLNSFVMQPYQLSDSLFMVAADYLVKLFAEEDYERLKDFNNALLEAGKMEQVVKYPDSTLQTLPI